MMKLRRFFIVFGNILLIIGILLISYPVYHGFLVDKGMEKAAEAFDREFRKESTGRVHSQTDESSEGYTENASEEGNREGAGNGSDELNPGIGGNSSDGLNPGIDGNSSKEQNPEIDGNSSEELYQAVAKKLLEAIQDYNQNLYLEGQKDMTDATSLENQLIDLSAYGIIGNTIGTIRIPAMNIELPILQGAAQENFLLGTAVCSQTSFPIGGENTNSVIAAHRGYKGGRYFRDIELLTVGDTIEITNYFTTLIYRVSEIRLVLPTDTDSIKIIPGRDMVTLMTCHPYIGHKYRYLVYCERDLEAELVLATESQTPNKTEESASNKQPVEASAINESSEDAATHAESLDENNTRIPFRSSYSEIMIDRYLPIITIAALVLSYLAISGRYKKRKEAPERE